MASPRESRRASLSGASRKSRLAPFRASLKCTRQASSIHRYFVPEGDLGPVLTKEAIQFILSSGIAPGSEAEFIEIVDDVHSRALKVFAILLLMEITELLPRFLGRGLYDDKLPFDETQLADVGALDDSTIKRFVLEQHTFLAPIFTKDADLLSLNSKHVLPFVQDQELDHGAFGVVYMIRIHAKHQRLQPSANGQYEEKCFARKQFRITPDCEKKFEAEKKILQLLLQLKHPNIVPLLGTYSYGGHLNMIFPLAETTLFNYLHSEPKPSAPEKVLLERFYHLTDALHLLHNFTHEENGRKLQRLGYHHDLKPQNILVRNERLIIADFGLANFKGIDESSKTSWKMGTRGYSPPEVGNGDVGRAYDIWSLACMLAEYVTFIATGSEGVIKFVDRRTTVTESITSDCFHSGKKVKPEVLQHLQELKSIDRSGGVITQVLELVEEMLEPDVENRPRSGIVLEKFAKALDISNDCSLKSPNTNSSERSDYHRSGFLASQHTLPSLPPSPLSHSASLSESHSESNTITYTVDQHLMEHTIPISRRNASLEDLTAVIPRLYMRLISLDNNWIMIFILCIVVFSISIICLSLPACASPVGDIESANPYQPQCFWDTYTSATLTKVADTLHTTA